MNAVHWLDTRGGIYNRQITAGFPSVLGYGLFKLLKWVKYTGLVPTHSGVDSLGHVLFIKNERPDIYADTYKFLEPMDYLTAKEVAQMLRLSKDYVYKHFELFGGMKFGRHCVFQRRCSMKS